MDEAHIYYKRFESLSQKLIRECKSGKIKSIENISHIIEEEISRRKKLGEYPNPKKKQLISNNFILQKQVKAM